MIDIDGIEAVDHSARAGLQISDVIATCVSGGVEPDLYGNCERRYAEILRPTLYNRNRNYLSYGVKIVPKPEQIDLTDQQKAFVDYFK